MDQATLYPDENESKKHKGSKSSTVQGPVSLSVKLPAMKVISVDMCGCCNQSCDGDGVMGQALQCVLVS